MEGGGGFGDPDAVLDQGYQRHPSPPNGWSAGRLPGSVVHTHQSAPRGSSRCFESKAYQFLAKDILQCIGVA